MVSDKFKKSMLINAVLLVTDLGAGLVLYNYGKSKGREISFSIPPGNELKSMLMVAGVTSILTGAALTRVEKRLKVEIFDETDQAFLDPDEWESIFTSFKGLKRQIGTGSNYGTPEGITNFLRGNPKETGRPVSKKKSVGGD